VKLWENAWEEFTLFLRFDQEIRTIIDTMNSIESLNARFRRAVRARGHFPNEQTALKCLFLTIVSLEPTGTDRKRWTNRWKPAPEYLCDRLLGTYSPSNEVVPEQLNEPGRLHRYSDGLGAEVWAAGMVSASSDSAVSIERCGTRR
jgi:hypothetical protein